MENEVFTEAVPTTLIMTFLMVVFFSGSWDERSILVGDDQSGDLGLILFLLTFVTSALSAGLGLAKCLKVGKFITYLPSK